MHRTVVVPACASHQRPSLLLNILYQHFLACAIRDGTPLHCVKSPVLRLAVMQCAHGLTSVVA
jgi:hypothetical protein